MKKLLSGMIAVIMVLSLGTTVFAAETVTEQVGSKGIDVQAKAVYINPDDVYDVPVSDGKASITTSDGAVISVTAKGADLDGLILNVIEMVSSEKEAYSWISGIMKSLSDKFTAYDIYFTDKDGKRVDVTGEVVVSITTPDGYTNVGVYHIDTGAKADKIASKQSGGNTVFTAKEFSYYALAYKANSSSGTTNTTSSTKPGNTKTPQTGDTSNSALWLALLLTSGTVLAMGGMARKRRKANTK